MSFLDDIKFKKHSKEVTLMLGEDVKKNLVIYMANDKDKILIKKFLGRFQYDKFMCEAVILRMIVGSKSTALKKARDIYVNMCDAINDPYKDIDKI